MILVEKMEHVLSPTHLLRSVTIEEVDYVAGQKTDVKWEEAERYWYYAVHEFKEIMVTKRFLQEFQITLKE